MRAVRCLKRTAFRGVNNSKSIGTRYSETGRQGGREAAGKEDPVEFDSSLQCPIQVCARHIGSCRRSYIERVSPPSTYSYVNSNFYNLCHSY